MNRRKVKKNGYRIRLTKPSDKFVYVSDSLTYERRKRRERDVILCIANMRLLTICVFLENRQNL